ncbi:hypothetical protein NPIL_21921 [Nephila pilipes]|uniref:Uncharacterized protein n=1 Tax=Nephila pilipes TaxID=299642 RepID=A0A8X6M8U7_NEPPI|nr:hypothetical protein NPIL_21921 [Nephila pilipes]
MSLHEQFEPWMLDITTNSNSQFPATVLFTDVVNFMREGFVNTHNAHIRIKGHLFVKESKPIYLPKRIKLSRTIRLAGLSRYGGRLTVAMVGLEGWLSPDRSFGCPGPAYTVAGTKNSSNKEEQFYRRM